MAVDVEAFVSVHQPQWDRLAYLTRRQRRLTGAEAEELVVLYQRVGTHLAALRAAGADPVSIGRLSGLIADARGAVTGAQAPVWRDISRYFLVSFPAALYASTPLVAHHRPALLPGRGLGRLADASAHPEVVDSIATPAQIQQLVEHGLRELLLGEPGAGLRAPGLDQQRDDQRRRTGARHPADPVRLHPLEQRARTSALTAGLMIGHDKGGRVLRPDHPARPARADRGVRRDRGRPATRLVLDRAGAADPDAVRSPRPAGPRSVWRSGSPRSC